MLYNPPSGSTDANAPYVGKNVAGGTQGSKVPPAAVEYTQREIVAQIAASGQAPTNNVLVQAAMALARGVFVGNLTGTGDLAVATLGVVFPQLLQGMRIGAVAVATNTVTNPKLRVVNLGSVGGVTDFPILKEDGSALAVGDIKAGRRYRFEADGAGNVLISGGGIGTSATSTGGNGSFEGQCRLVRTSATLLTLNPVGSGKLFVGGAWVTVPASGPTLANTAPGLASFDITVSVPTLTAFSYIYAFMNAGVLTLEASTTAPAVDATYGHRIKTGDPTRSLVGMATLDGSAGGVFVDTRLKRYVASYFNRVGRDMLGPPPDLGVPGQFTSSASPIEISSPANRLPFLAWADELNHLSIDAWAANYSGYVGNYFYLYVDGQPIDGTPSNKQNYNSFQTAGYTTPASLTLPRALTEGMHYLTAFVKVSGSGAYFNIQTQVGLRS